MTTDTAGKEALLLNFKDDTLTTASRRHRRVPVSGRQAWKAEPEESTS
jgi:hypothetical protein